jgi:hypothetical protein
MAQAQRRLAALDQLIAGRTVLRGTPGLAVGGAGGSGG